MREVQRLEQVINVILGKPLAWTLYATWLVTKYGIRAVLRLCSWLHTRYVASAGKV
jgi:hypothetical protein